MARTPKPSGRKKRRARKLSSYSRQSPFREIRERILIVCEGEKTEPNYFHTMRKSLKLSSVNVQIVDSRGKTSPEQIVKRATEYRQDSDIDEVWCIFDAESPTQREAFDRAVDFARANKIKPAVSNPAFEFWLLLHFEHTTRPFANAHKVIEALNIHVANYEKNYQDCAIFLTLVDSAVRRAKSVLKNHKNHGDSSFAPSPSTYVHYLIQKLKAMRA